MTLLVAGKNPGWKQEASLGKVNNQNFVQLPYGRFLKILKFVTMQYSIRYEEKEESSTSKADFLERDFIPVYGTPEAKEAVFSGERIHRGQYHSKNGTILNADVNGSMNILRKHYPDTFGNIKYFSWTWKKVERITYEMLQPSAG